MLGSNIPINLDKIEVDETTLLNLDGKTGRTGHNEKRIQPKDRE